MLTDCLPATLGFWMPGTMEWIVIGLIALLLFGRRLPEVARSLGKSYTEFKRGLNDVQDEISQAGSNNEQPSSSPSVTASDGGDVEAGASDDENAKPV